MGDQSRDEYPRCQRPRHARGNIARRLQPRPAVAIGTRAADTAAPSEAKRILRARSDADDVADSTPKSAPPASRCPPAWRDVRTARCGRNNTLTARDEQHRTDRRRELPRIHDEALTRFPRRHQQIAAIPAPAMAPTPALNQDMLSSPVDTHQVTAPAVPATVSAPDAPKATAKNAPPAAFAKDAPPATFAKDAPPAPTPETRHSAVQDHARRGHDAGCHAVKDASRHGRANRFRNRSARCRQQPAAGTETETGAAVPRARRS